MFLTHILVSTALSLVFFNSPLSLPIFEDSQPAVSIPQTLDAPVMEVLFVSQQVE